MGAMTLTLVLVALLISGNVSRVYSQGGTAVATMSVQAPYCTPAIAAANQAKGYFIPMISKGFAAQFWQAVKQGAYQAGADCGVGVDYVGPATDQQVDVQIDMLQTALSKNPSAI